MTGPGGVDVHSGVPSNRRQTQRPDLKGSYMDTNSCDRVKIMYWTRGVDIRNQREPSVHRTDVTRPSQSRKVDVQINREQRSNRRQTKKSEGVYTVRT